MRDDRERGEGDLSWPLIGEKSSVKEEVKKQLWLSGPLIAVSLLQFCLQVISVMFVGHLGSLPLSAASIATSFASVTGFSFLMGTASALDTLCGQAYGAKKYGMLGIQMQRAMFVLTLASIPLSIIWANTEHLLVFFGQNKSIATLAGSYAKFMIPSIFAYGLLQCFNRVSRSCSCQLHFALRDILPFLRLAVPSALMVCLEMWSFELLVLLSGLLPNPVLETSVLSICLNTSGTMWMIPFGLSGAASTRISNELGAGNPKVAKLAVRVVICIAVAERVARGCGWQKIGAIINLGSYYLVGVPSGLLLAFHFHVGGRGLWLGIICALVVQVFGLGLVTIFTNWDEEAKKATNRIESSSSVKDFAVDDRSVVVF
ncbi:unnamed protein product [Arabidopsis thaliana]|uniref:(thale cress) hypothetical protein n=1 Tax=Arabidopsis thaliana TaxID=3702 RepID=A0A7G2FJY6_ARATH|nr:unnamed protein product [Arabidopsis thaliana]